ncbi:hypothetical protein [Erwinia sp. SLM-02]|uniref:hypothetical protein n=1 Tax=Erwinia sp. SLM-02 TaxID=3020057 RepID=UPI00308035E7
MQRIDAEGIFCFPSHPAIFLLKRAIEHYRKHLVSFQSSNATKPPGAESAIFSISMTIVDFWTFLWRAVVVTQRCALVFFCAARLSASYSP